MGKILKSHQIENFTKPDPAQNINPILLGQLPAGDPPHSILHYINKDNPMAPPPQNPSDDAMYLFWEEGVKNWLANPSPQNTGDNSG